MSLLTDLRNVSESAIEQLSGQFHDLPRPLLAAIGAGDIAVERLAKLREQLRETVGGGAPSGDDVKAFASDLPARAQQIAGELAHNLEQFASTAPERVQKLIGELPAKASELSESLSGENVRGTVEAYTQMVGTIYGNLAERGGETANRMRAKASARGGAGSSAPRRAQPAARTRRTATATAGRRAAAAAGTATGARRTRTAAGTASKGAASSTAASRTAASRAASRTKAAPAPKKAAPKRTAAPKRAPKAAAKVTPGATQPTATGAADTPQD